MRLFWLLTPALLVACSGGGTSGDDTGTAVPGDDDDDTTMPGDDDDDTTIGDDDDDTGTAHVCHAEPATLSIGSGAGLYAPLSSGDPVVLVHGPQGGWHIDLGGSVSGFSDLIEIAGYVTVVGGATIAGQDQQPSRVALVGWSDTTCTGEFYDIRAFVDDEGINTLDYICGLETQPLEIEITVTDLIDPSRAVTETLLVEAALDPVDVEPCDGL